MIEYIATSLAEILSILIVFGVLVGGIFIVNIYYMYKARKRDKAIQRRQVSRDTCGND